MRGAKSAPGPSAGAAICPAPFRDGTPASQPHRRARTGRLLAAPVRHPHTGTHCATTARPPASRSASRPRSCSPPAPPAATRARTPSLPRLPPRPAACTTGTAELTLPAGFCATMFADSIGRARHIAVASNGDVYVALEGTRPPSQSSRRATAVPKPLVRRAARHEPRRPRRRHQAQSARSATPGIALANGFLYVDEGTQIVRYARERHRARARAVSARSSCTGSRCGRGHRARNIAIGDDGALYLNVGSTTNSCQKKDRAAESPGNDPCTELETRAGIWRFDANKPGQSFSPGERFATGIRNGMGIARRAGRQAVRDPARPRPAPRRTGRRSSRRRQVLGGESRRGAAAGEPGRRLRLAVLLLLDGGEEARDGAGVRRRRQEDGSLRRQEGAAPPCSLRTGRRCRSSSTRATSFPERYRNGAFIAFHGSWNRAPEPQGGYRVVFQPMANGGRRAASSRRSRTDSPRCRRSRSSPARRSTAPSDSRRARTARCS